MKKILTSVSSLLLASFSLQAAALIVDTFSYPNGTLVGQGPWAQTGSTVTSPIQVTDGRAVLGTSGQDVNAALPIVINSDGSSFYYGLTLNVSSAQAAGDYFAHLSASSSLFYNRLFVQSSGNGFVLGLLETAPGTATYGSTVLDFNTDYRIVVAQQLNAGVLNDTIKLYVNPTDAVSELNNSAYWTKSWASTSAETNAFYYFGLRQGSSSSAAALTVDDLAVGQTFADVTLVPEPGTLSLLAAFGLLLARFSFHRKD